MRERATALGRRGGSGSLAEAKKGTVRAGHTAVWLCHLLLAGCMLLPPPPEATPPVSAPAGTPAAAAPAAASAPAAATPPSPAASAAIAPLPAADAASATPVDLAVRDALAFHERTRQLPPPDLARELARLSEAPPSPQSAVQLALLLGQTRTNGDTARALQLLDQVVQSPAPEAAPWQPLARLLAARYAEQRRLEEQIERQNQQVRDQQRRLQQLTEKLEALKAIERSLTTLPGAATPASAVPTPPSAPRSPPP